MKTSRFIAISQATFITAETRPLSGETKLAHVATRCIEHLAHSHAPKVRHPVFPVYLKRSATTSNEKVHLAHHGLQDLKRVFASDFMLHDGHLTIKRFLQLGSGVDHPRCADAFACRTTVGDEIRARWAWIAAMQFVGSRSRRNAFHSNFISQGQPPDDALAA